MSEDVSFTAIADFINYLNERARGAEHSSPSNGGDGMSRAYAEQLLGVIWKV